MPNGGTDNCMNCRHNRANQASVNVKTAPTASRLAFCNVHNIPILNNAWTYCANILNITPDISVPIYTTGLSSEGYARVPWLGRIAPSNGSKIDHCDVCNESAEKSLIIDSDALGLHVAFCSNEHYEKWHKQQEQMFGFERLYSIGRNAIHEGLLSGDIDAIQSTIKRADSFKDLNHADLFGWTPLHLAAFIGFEVAVTLLLESGANPKVVDVMENKPIDLAGSEGFSSSVQILANGSKTSNEENEASLLKAASEGNLELVEYLVNTGTNIECRNDSGKTPLFLAVWDHHYTTAVFLLDHGADVMAEDRFSNSCLTTVDTWYARKPDILFDLIHKWNANAESRQVLD